MVASLTISMKTRVSVIKNSKKTMVWASICRCKSASIRSGRKVAWPNCQTRLSILLKSCMVSSSSMCGAMRRILRRQQRTTDMWGGTMIRLHNIEVFIRISLTRTCHQLNFSTEMYRVDWSLRPLIMSLLETVDRLLRLIGKYKKVKTRIKITSWSESMSTSQTTTMKTLLMRQITIKKAGRYTRELDSQN